MEMLSSTIPEHLDPCYSIGEAAQICNVSVHTLRLYEAENLIILYKTKSGRRYFSELEIEKIKNIRLMIQQGLNFEGIRRLIALVPCWKLRNCTNGGEWKTCLSYRSRSLPCWASEKKCLHPLPSCRDCGVYQQIISYDDIIGYIQSSFA